MVEKIAYYIQNKELLGLKGYTDPSTGSFISYEGLKVDDVLAALLGHEMTHADARHTARKYENIYFLVGLMIMAPLILFHLPKKNLWSRVCVLALNIMLIIAQPFYYLFQSRSHELEADKYGSMLSAESGYNPIGALFFQEILRKETPIPKGIWSTHPPYQERQNTIYPIVRDWQQIHLSA